MPLSADTVRKQLNILKPLMNGASLKTIRRGQNKIGEMTESRYRGRVMSREHSFERFKGAWLMPRDERREGVILYLHGGGYTCGDLEYAMGFGSMLSHLSGARVFCIAYRLAPEHPFPAALDDALEAYCYLLQKGYSPNHIALCGESAGGGLCYSLLLKLREKGIPMPSGVVAISPWTDLTASGESYKKNKDVDPSMSEELLRFFADSYTKDREDPLVSPVLADLSSLPPSLIFAGGDEIMLSDAEGIHERLTEAGCKSKLVVSKDRWHAYILYGLREDARDIAQINRFLNQVMSKENKLRWLRLDNAAKIYPAASRQNWSNVFRLSATLKEEVDKEVLRSALDVTARRFPSISVRLRSGVFWYYLEQLSEAPELTKESSYPLTRMTKKDLRRCAFRVIAYKKRIAVEIFHSLTDGNGAMIFLKSLVAEYISQKYDIRIPAEKGVLGRLEEPSEEELEDSFQKYSGSLSASRRENNAWRVKGTLEEGGFLHVTCFEVPSSELVERAHALGISVTNLLCAVMMMALQELQKERYPNIRKRRPIRVLLPVNLRGLFESRTLRNFALYTTPEILPRLGEYSFEEICNVIKHCMGSEITPKHMSMKIAVNVNSERLMAVRLMPLFIKNIVMKAVFDTVGERKSCLALSNLGAVALPEEMLPFVDRMDFILGPQAKAPYNCGVLTFGDTAYINFIRNVKESRLEYHFHSVLRDMGFTVSVCSNSQEREG